MDRINFNRRAVKRVSTLRFQPLPYSWLQLPSCVTSVDHMCPNQRIQLPAGWVGAASVSGLNWPLSSSTTKRRQDSSAPRHDAGLVTLLWDLPPPARLLPVEVCPGLPVQGAPASPPALPGLLRESPSCQLKGQTLSVYSVAFDCINC